MVRPPLSRLEHERGQRLGMLLREARGPRSMAEIAAVSGVPAETLRKIETGRIATPAFFTVAALAEALGLALAEIVQACTEPPEALSARWRRQPGLRADVDPGGGRSCRERKIPTGKERSDEEAHRP